MNNIILCDLPTDKKARDVMWVCGSDGRPGTWYQVPRLQFCPFEQSATASLLFENSLVLSSIYHPWSSCPSCQRAHQRYPSSSFSRLPPPDPASRQVWRKKALLNPCHRACHQYHAPDMPQEEENGEIHILLVTKNPMQTTQRKELTDICFSTPVDTC